MAPATSKDEHSEPILRSGLYAVFRRKYAVAFLFLLVSVPMVLTAFVAPKRYRSDATFLVKVGIETVVDPTLMDLERVPSNPGRENQLNTELEILRSRDVAQKVVERVGTEALIDPKQYAEEHRRPGWTPPPPPTGLSRYKQQLRQWLESRREPPTGTKQDAVQILQESFETGVIEDTSIIYASVISGSPEAAQDVLRALTETYLQAHMSAYRNPQAEEFFAQRTDEWEMRLAETERKLEAYRNEAGVADLVMQMKMVEQELSNVKGEIREDTAELGASAARIRMLEQQVAKLPDMIVTRRTTGIVGDSVQVLQEQLLQLRAQRQMLLNRYFPDTSPVVRASQDIAEVERVLAESEKLGEMAETTKGPNPTRGAAEQLLVQERANHDAMAARLAKLQEERARLAGDIRRLNRAEREVRRLEADRELQEAYLQQYRERSEQARIDSALEEQKVSNISIVQEPTFPTRSVAANKKVMVLAAVVLGALAGLGYALLMHLVDRTVQTPHRAESALQVPVLAAVTKTRRRHVLPRPTGRGKSRTLETNERLRGVYDNLCVSLLAPPEEEDPLFKTIALIGCKPGEGVSSVTANLALSFARISHGRVLVIDANFMNPTLHEVYNTPATPGLSDLLEQTGELDADGLTTSPVENLDVMPIGDNPEILDGEAGMQNLAQRLPALRYLYRYILLDLPAMSAWPSSVRLARTADAALMVVKAEGVRADEAATCRKMLQGAEVNLLGAVLNRQQQPIPGWLARRI